MLYGYGGKILRVDLTSGRILSEKTDPLQMLSVIGGRGLNSTTLYHELKRDIDPLSPENLLLIGVGPLTGTLRIEMPGWCMYYHVLAPSCVNQLEEEI